jgi:hypothetical protein
MPRQIKEVYHKYLNRYIIDKGQMVDFLRHIPLNSDATYLYYTNLFGQSLFDRENEPILGFKINRHTGQWFDRESDKSGEDLIDLLKAQQNLRTRTQAFYWLLNLYKPKDLLFLLKTQP